MTKPPPGQPGSGAPAGADLDALYREYGSRVLAYAVRRTRDADDGADVVQEVFEVAWRRRTELPADRPLPWLYGVAYNVILARIRRRARALDAENAYSRDSERWYGATAHPLNDPLGHQVVVSDEAAHVLELVRTSLARRDQEVLLLACWEELSGKDLGVALGCSAAAAKVRLMRARNKLRAAVRRQAAAHSTDLTSRTSERSPAAGRSLGETR